MAKNVKKKIYEEFHKETLVQSRIIKENNFTYRIILAVLNRFSDPPKDVLDIGCGAGTLSFYLASKGNRVVGIDVARNAIEACTKSSKLLGLNKNTSFKVMDFPKQTPSKKFDLIIFSEVIEHLKNDDLALKKIFLLLKRGGVGIISTPSKNAPMYRLGLADEFDQRVGHLRRYTMDELVDKCKSTGFKILETKKTEGIVRNFLFLNPIAGKFIRFIKFFIADFVAFVDEISLKVFGESDIFAIVKKP